MPADNTRKRRIKKPETLRERAEKKTNDKAPKPRRIHRTASAAKRPITAARRVGRKEYHPIKLPDSKIGNFLAKSRRFTPRYFRDAWAELKQVTWPDRQETVKLTIAVFTFAIVFGLIIAVTDYGLEKLFREVLIN